MMLDLRERIIEMVSERRVLANGECIFCCAGKAGKSITRQCTGYTVKRVCSFVSVRRKRTGPADREPVELSERVNEQWSMDFMSDVLSSGTRFRTLNIVDEFSRECPAIEVDTSLRGTQVIRVLQRLKEMRGLRPTPSPSTTDPN